MNFNLIKVAILIDLKSYKCAMTHNICIYAILRLVCKIGQVRTISRERVGFVYHLTGLSLTRP